jgi:anti-sigma28 factor (negative regulator of flagellin synthesis)
MISEAPSIYTNGLAGFRETDLVVGLNSRQVDNQSTEAYLFEDALALSERLQVIKELPDVREDVVEAILRQIQTGTYQINVELLAQKIFPFFNLA